MGFTEQEREWMESRNFPAARCQCEDWKDAAEFEVRVAASLAELVNSEPWPNLWPECISCERHAKEGDKACPPCVLKEASLAVETEMEGEGK